MKTNRQRPVAVVGVLAMTALLAACGGSSEGGRADEVTTDYSCDQPDADTMTEVSVTGMPILSNGAIYAGIDEGFFAGHGLDVTVQTVDSLPATVAAVQGGSTDFAFTGTIQMLQSIQSGVSVVAVAPFAGIAPDYWDKMQAGEEGYTEEITALLVQEDAGIEDPGDLDGKTVAISDAKGQSELTTRVVIDEHGGDPDSVRFVTMAPADAYNALLAGQVDAASSAVPFINGYQEKGVKVISWNGVEALHEGPTSFMIATSDYVKKNPDVAARFNCAIREAAEFANASPDEIRAVTAREQGLEPSALAAAVVPYFYSATDLDGLDRFQELMVDNGFLREEIDPETIIIPAALGN